jgi:hypothetical protein
MDLDHFLAETVGKSPQHQKFYHFTDRKNLPLIRQHGLLSTSELRSRGLLENVKTGGDAASLQSDSCKGDGRIRLPVPHSQPPYGPRRDDGRSQTRSGLS